MAIPSALHDQDIEVQKFLAFLREEQTIYLGESKAEASIYTPRSDLLRYFADGRGSLDDLLKAVLKEEEHIIPASETVIQQYLAVFTILLSIGQAQYLNRFIERDYNDERLPFFDRPRHFPKAVTGSFFDAFFDAQFRFCPIRFAKNPVNLQIEPEQILPLRNKQQIKVVGPAITYKVELHGDYDPFVEDSSPFQIDLGTNTPAAHTYIFKEFHGKVARAAYDKELTAFLFLQKSGQLLGKTLVGFYGSFIHEDTSTIILEYADRGTLDDYMNSVPPPTTGEDITRLWESLLKLQEALHASHNLSAPYSQEIKQYSLLRGWHQHLKPENIGVVSTQTDSEYDCQFRIMDLGTSHDLTETEIHSTRAYAAPECSQGGNPQDVNMQMADIWSLGCIYSEFAVWASLGLTGLKDYRADRADEGTELGAQDIGAFHDGLNLLQSVRAWNYQAVDNKNTDDRVTEAVLQQMVEEMLYEEGDARPSTRQLKMKVNKILTRAREQHLAELRRHDSVASSSTTYSSMGLSTRSRLSHHMSVRSARSDSSDDSSLGYGVGLVGRLGRSGTGRSNVAHRDSTLPSPQPIEEEKEVFSNTGSASTQSMSTVSPSRVRRSPVASVYQSTPNGHMQELEGSGAPGAISSRLLSRAQAPDTRSIHSTSTMDTALLNGDDKEIVVTRGPPPAAIQRLSTNVYQDIAPHESQARPQTVATPAPQSPSQPVASMAQTVPSTAPPARATIDIRPDNDPRSQVPSAYTAMEANPPPRIDIRPDHDLQRSLSSPNAVSYQTSSLSESLSAMSTIPAPEVRRSISSPSGPHARPTSSAAPSIAPTTSDNASLNRPATRSSLQTYKPYLNMIDGLLWLNSKKASASNAALRDESYISTLADRDFIFLIDDSRTMRAHREMTSRAVRLLSWLLKKYDQNGMDLYFMNKAGKTHARPGHSSDLQRPLLKQLDAASGVSDVSVRLVEILNEFRQRNAAGSGAAQGRGSIASIGGSKTVTGAKKIMVYVLTDALWDANSAAKLKASMESLAATSTAQGASEKAVGIQFIRTVQRTDIAEKMNVLKSGQYSDRIGIDSEYLEGNVFRLLLGPITDIWEGEDDQEHIPAQPRTEQDVATARGSVSTVRDSRGSTSMTSATFSAFGI